MSVKRAYPRCRLSILDKSAFRLEQCRQRLQRLDHNFQVESEHNTEVRTVRVRCYYMAEYILSFSWTFHVSNFLEDLMMSSWPLWPSTPWLATILRKRGWISEY